MPRAEVTARDVWTWTALNLSVWPLALFLAALVGVGQDPAGAGMYGGMAFIAVIVLLGVPISFRLVRLLRARGKGASAAQRGVAILSIVLVLLVALPMLGVLFLEGYWWLGLVLTALLYLGFFGFRRPARWRSR